MSEDRFQPRPMFGVIGGYGGYWTPITGRPRIPYFTYYAMSRTAMVIQDIAMKGLIATNIDALKDNLNLMLTADFGQISTQVAAGETGDVDQLKANLIHNYKGLYDNWKAGVGHGVGTAYSSAMEQFMATGQYLYAYKALAVQTSVTPRLRRHWMKTYTPTVPDSRMAYQLLLRGKIKDTDFQRYASYDGWNPQGIDYLRTVWSQIPSARAAFMLMKRGLITTAEFYKYVQMNSWPTGWGYKLWGLFASLPTIGQAARMYLRGSLTEDQYMGYAEYDGYNPYEAERMMVNYLAYPTPREANYMWRRNIVDLATRNKIYMAQGYLSNWWELISENYTKIFNPLNAFKLKMRGKLSNTDFLQTVYENGWTRAKAPLFDSLYENVPTSQEAFYMWCKGLLSVNERDLAYQAYGWMPDWWPKLTQNYYYVPTIYDLFRIADAVEIDEIWAADVMTRRGVRPSDQAKLWPMLKIRPLRDEIARQVAIWIRRYELGWCSDVTLEAALDAMIADGYIQTTEKTLITEEAYLKYENELISEQIVIWMWYFRMGVITEAQYLEALISLDIRREKANLMVEEQKAMGYYGYY